LILTYQKQKIKSQTPSNDGDASNFNHKPDSQVLSPEQLQQLALLRYINPYAAAGLPFGYGGLPGGMGAFGAMNGVAGDPGAIQVSIQHLIINVQTADEFMVAVHIGMMMP